MSEIFSTRTGESGGFDENMAATVDYFNRSEPKYPAARLAKDRFAKWWVDVGWYDKHFDSQNVLNIASNYKRDFDLGNTLPFTPERTAVEQYYKTGITSQGQYKEAEQAKTSSGKRAVESKPWLPLEWKIGLAVVGAGAVLAFSYGASQSIPKALLSRKSGGNSPEHEPSSEPESSLFKSLKERVSRIGQVQRTRIS